MDSGALEEPIALDAMKQSARAEPRPTTPPRLLVHPDRTLFAFWAATE